MNSIIVGKFEFKKGNNLASLCESLYVNLDSMYSNIACP